MIPKSLYVYAGAALLLFLGFWYHGEKRFTDGAASRDKEVQLLNTNLAQAAVVLNQCDDNAKSQAAAAKAQRDMADAALNAATDRDRNRTKELTQAVNRLNAARQTADCRATSEALICSSMANY